MGIMNPAKEPFKAEKELEEIKQEVIDLITRWTKRNKSRLESAEWHTHGSYDKHDDVLIVITKHEQVFRLIVQPVEFSATEKRSRAYQKLIKKGHAERIDYDSRTDEGKTKTAATSTTGSLEHGKGVEH
jgi:hypothetical protein